MSNTSRRPLDMEELIAAMTAFADGHHQLRLPITDTDDVGDRAAKAFNRMCEAFVAPTDEVMETEIEALADVLLRVAAGEFSARAHRNYRGNPLDALAFMINAMAEEVESLFDQLESKRAYIDAVLGNMNEPLLVINRSSRIETLNRAAAELLGVAMEQLRGAPLSDILPSAQTSRPEWLSAVLAGSTLRHTEVTFVDPDGHAVELIVSGSPLQLRGEANVQAGVFVARDMRQIRDLVRLVEEANRSLAAMRNTGS